MINLSFATDELSNTNLAQALASLSISILWFQLHKPDYDFLVHLKLSSMCLCRVLAWFVKQLWLFSVRLCWQLWLLDFIQWFVPAKKSWKLQGTLIRLLISTPITGNQIFQGLKSLSLSPSMFPFITFSQANCVTQQSRTIMSQTWSHHSLQTAQNYHARL